MLQVELYVTDVATVAALFRKAFGLRVIERKRGWRHLRHDSGYDIMLFDPALNREGESHWPWPATGLAGTGVEIVICTDDVPGRRILVEALGYHCSELRYPPWGSTEFLFRLREGYLIRAKQLPPASA